MNFFAFVDPSEPDNKKDPVKLGIALFVAFIGQWIISCFFGSSMRVQPTLLGFYMGYFFTIHILIAFNGV